MTDYGVPAPATIKSSSREHPHIKVQDQSRLTPISGDRARNLWTHSNLPRFRPYLQGLEAELVQPKAHRGVYFFFWATHGRFPREPLENSCKKTVYYAAATRCLCRPPAFLRKSETRHNNINGHSRLRFVDQLNLNAPFCPARLLGSTWVKVESIPLFRWPWTIGQFARHPNLCIFQGPTGIKNCSEL